MYDFVLALHFVGLALGLGTGFAMLVLGRAAAGLDPPERGKFMMRASVLSKNGAIGLLLLVTTGPWLLFGKWPGMGFIRTGPRTFHVKLVLVVISLVLFGVIQVTAKKARVAAAAGSPEAGLLMAKIGKLSTGMLLLVLTIVVMATLSFH